MQHTQCNNPPKMSSHSQYLKKLHKSALEGVVDDLVKEKEEGWKNRTLRDSYTTKLQCLELMGILITQDALYKRVERQIKKQSNEATRLVEELVVYHNDPNVSSISSLSTGSNTTDGNNGSQDLLNAMISPSKAGRPKGSTNQKKRDDVKKSKECVNAIAHAYNNELTKQRGLQQKLVKGFLEQVTQEKKEEFGVC